jgi:N-acetylmuramoyl-L-alanine amidase
MAIKVLIDPGHGGKDPGAVGKGGTRESRINLNVANKVGLLLRRAVVHVTYTRTTDLFLPINERVAQANRGAHYFLSIHCNSDGPSAHGIETLVFSVKSPAYRWALRVNAALVAATRDRDRGVKVRTNLGVLKARSPAILVEIGFISNRATEADFRRESYLDAIAKAIADGTLAFLELPSPALPAPPKLKPEVIT